MLIFARGCRTAPAPPVKICSADWRHHTAVACNKKAVMSTVMRHKRSTVSDAQLDEDSSKSDAEFHMIITGPTGFAPILHHRLPDSVRPLQVAQEMHHLRRVDGVSDCAAHDVDTGRPQLLRDCAVQGLCELANCRIRHAAAGRAGCRTHSRSSALHPAAPLCWREGWRSSAAVETHMQVSFEVGDGRAANDHLRACIEARKNRRQTSLTTVAGAIGA